MSRLPSIGGDDNEWGVILNDYLSVSLDSAGNIKASGLPVATLSTAGALRLASTPEATAGTDASHAITPATLKTVADTKANLSHVHSGADITSGTVSATYLPTSTTSALGIVELATPAETITGIDTVRAVTPAGVDAALIVGVGPGTLTDATSITTDASLSSYFRVTLLGNRTLAAPTNPTDGQRVLWEFTASGADRTITPAVGSSGAFKFGSDFTTIPPILSGTTTFMGALYRSSTTRWHIISLGQGH